MWGAAWLYWATNDETYLRKAESYYEDYDVNGMAWEFSWDNKATGAQVLLSRLSAAPDVYRSDLRNFCRYAREDVPRSPLGQAFFGEWGSLRYAANVAFICMEVILDSRMREGTKNMPPINRHRQFRPLSLAWTRPRTESSPKSRSTTF